jgi:DNA-binding GntR family transcriptional regulator
MKEETRIVAGQPIRFRIGQNRLENAALIEAADPDDFRRLDSRLHLAIAEAAGSPSLVLLVAENRMRLNALLDRIPLLGRNITHSDDQHDVIVNAILAGDPDRAGAAMLAHVGGSATLLHGFLD